MPSTTEIIGSVSNSASVSHIVARIWARISSGKAGGAGGRSGEGEGERERGKAEEAMRKEGRSGGLCRITRRRQLLADILAEQATPSGRCAPKHRLRRRVPSTGRNI